MLLAHWKATTTDHVIARLIDPTVESDAFARRDVMNALVMHMDIGLERSIRSWGVYDRAVQDAINATDRTRIEAVVSQMDDDSEETHARAAAQYMTYLGFILVQDPQTQGLMMKWGPRAEIVFRDELAEGPPAPPAE